MDWVAGEGMGGGMDWGVVGGLDRGVGVGASIGASVGASTSGDAGGSDKAELWHYNIYHEDLDWSFDIHVIDICGLF